MVDQEELKKSKRYQKLGRQGPSEKAELELLTALRDPSWKVRAEAARALQVIGAGGCQISKTLDALVEAIIDDPIVWYRKVASWSIVSLDPWGKRTKERIEKLLIDSSQDSQENDPSSQRKVRLLNLVQDFPRGTFADESLIMFLCDESWEVRVASVKALGSQSIPQNEVFESLFERLNTDEDTVVREHTAEAFLNIGGRDATQFLLKALDDQNDSVSSAILRCLTHLELEVTPVVTRLIRTFLVHQNLKVRCQAILLIASLVGDTSELFYDLINTLDGYSKQVDDAVKTAFAYISEEDPTKIQTLWEMMDQLDPRIRSKVFTLFRDLPMELPKDAEIPPAVVKSLINDPHSPKSVENLWILRHVPTARNLDTFQNALLAPHVKVRWRALLLLKQARKPLPDELVFDVRRILGDSSRSVRNAAVLLVQTLEEQRRWTVSNLVRRTYESETEVSRNAAIVVNEVRDLLPAILSYWLGKRGNRYEIEKFLEDQLKNPKLSDTVIDAFCETSASHANWHKDIAVLRSQKRGQTFNLNVCIPKTPDPKDALELADYAALVAEESASIARGVNQVDSEIREKARIREYNWHIGRLIDLIIQEEFGAIPRDSIRRGERKATTEPDL